MLLLPIHPTRLANRREITSRKISTRSPTSKVLTSLGGIRPRWHSDQQGSATSTENDDTATSNGGRAGGILFSPRRNDSQSSLESVKSSNMHQRWPSTQGAASLQRSGSESSASCPGGGVRVGVGAVGGESHRTFNSNALSPACTPRKLSEPPAVEISSQDRRCKACKVVLPGSHSPNLEVCRECLSTGLFSMGGADDVSGGGGKRRPLWMGEGSIKRNNSKEGQPTIVKGVEPALDHAPSPRVGPVGGFGASQLKHEPAVVVNSNLKRSREQVPGPQSAVLLESPEIIGSSLIQSSIRYSDQNHPIRQARALGL